MTYQTAAYCSTTELYTHVSQNIEYDNILETPKYTPMCHYTTKVDAVTNQIVIDCLTIEL